MVLPDKLKINGAILADQVKSLDWRIRKAKFIAHAPVETLTEVISKIQAIIS